jgi:predicted dehydrogenase
MKRAFLILCWAAIPLAAQQYKMAVVSMLHTHVYGHLGAIMKSDQVKLVGVSETLPELIARAEKGDNTRPAVPESLIFNDWRKMIDETKPDFVWAFTPTNEHLDVVSYCAPRGIHVMMEKPLAANYKDALEIAALAKKHNILVMANYGSTWGAAQYAVKSVVDSGEIGPIWRLHALTGHGGPGDPAKSPFVAWLADPVKNGGGALVDFGCYLVNWSLWLKGMPESVYASTNHLKPQMFPKVEDNATIILNYKDGVAILEATWDLPPAQRVVNEVYGTKGSIAGNLLFKPGQKDGGRGGPQGSPIEVTPLPPERTEAIAYMVNRLKTKQPLDGPSALDLNVNVQEVLEAAKISVKTGQAVPLPLKK